MIELFAKIMQPNLSNLFVNLNLLYLNKSFVFKLLADNSRLGTKMLQEVRRFRLNAFED